MIVKARVKRSGDIIGYVVDDGHSDIFIDISETYKYGSDNVLKLSNGLWRAKSGNIPTVKEIEIQNRSTSSVGRPGLIYKSSLGRMSLTQKKLLEKIRDRAKVVINRKDEKIKTDMIDLSVLTACTGLEFALFERNDRYVVFKGSATSIHLSKNELAKLLNGKYKWVGHIHPGDTFNCLMPSDGDYNTLRLFNQRHSVIYNSIGHYYVFGEE